MQRRLRWTRRRKARTPVTGLVLSGGGARAGFQVGALRYLCDRVSISPSVITGTSAGAILGTLLAQGDSREELLGAAPLADRGAIDLGRRLRGQSSEGGRRRGPPRPRARDRRCRHMLIDLPNHHARSRPTVSPTHASRSPVCGSAYLCQGKTLPQHCRGSAIDATSGVPAGPLCSQRVPGHNGVSGPRYPL